MEESPGDQLQGPHTGRLGNTSDDGGLKLDSAMGGKNSKDKDSRIFQS